jgi:hypothetical protein
MSASNSVGSCGHRRLTNKFLDRLRKTHDLIRVTGRRSSRINRQRPAMNGPGRDMRAHAAALDEPVEVSRSRADTVSIVVQRRSLM